METAGPVRRLLSHCERDAAGCFADIEVGSPSARVSHVMRCAFEGRRIVLFSGGGAREDDDVLNEVRAIERGGRTGSIIGRNAFQRHRDEALSLLDRIAAIYRGESA